MPKSLNNSTTKPLGANETFEGRSQTVDAYNQITVNGVSDADGTLYIEQSSNGTDWDYSTNHSIVASTPFNVENDIIASEFRVRYENDTQPQNFFRLQTLLFNSNPTIDKINEIDTKLTSIRDDMVTESQNTTTISLNSNETNVKLDTIIGGIGAATNVEVYYNRDLRITPVVAVNAPLLFYGWSAQNTFGNANLQIHMYDSLTPTLNTTVPFQMLFVRPDKHMKLYLPKPVILQNGLSLIGTGDQAGTVSAYATNTGVGQCNIIIYYVLL